MCIAETPTPSRPGSSPQPSDCTTEPCPPTVTVRINLSATIACPGHLLEISAAGSPDGGTYEWTISGGTADLIDGSGNPTRTGESLYLRAFEADDETGNIPDQTATIGVTYTHPLGDANDNKEVPVHGIEFVVTNTTINAGLTQAFESAEMLRIREIPGTATVSTDPEVQIQLAPSCPRKTECASNHRVGWLQTVLTNDRRTRYTHTLLEVTMPTPIRDVVDGRIHPFYSTVTSFTGDRDKQTAHHEDSPGINRPWVDARAGAPAPPPPVNQQLRHVSFSNSFTAWLVVQNIEWSIHDPDNSFAFLKHFDWSMELITDVDTTFPLASRCSTANNPPTIGALQDGKGANDPVLTVPSPKTASVTSATEAPEV